MKKKILYVATVDSHIKNFHLPFLEMMKEQGWETHVVTNGREKIPYCDKKHTICIERSPFKLNNIKAIKKMKQLLEKECFDIIHCHTPMGATVARIAAIKTRKKGTRVIYTAHGFHFYKGAPIINWLLFYPVEKWLAKYTDTIIAINKEDFARAKRSFGKRCHDIQYIPGVGIDAKKFDIKMTEKEKHELRMSLGIKDNDYVMIFPARLDKNKNQKFLIEHMSNIINKNTGIHLLLAGEDELNGKYQRFAKKLNIEDNVHFLGNRNDVPKLLNISDLAVSSSKREGLPINLLEAAQCNLPMLVSDCRGNRDIAECYGGIIYTKNDFDKLAEAIISGKRKGNKNHCDPSKFDISSIKERIINIYEKV